MKLLLDQNISKRIVPALQACYPDTSQAYIEGLETASDQKIWAFAKENDFIIVTKDSDFHEFSLMYGPPPKVIWLKCGNQSNQFIRDLLLNMLELITAFEEESSAACLEIY